MWSPGTYCCGCFVPLSVCHLIVVSILVHFLHPPTIYLHSHSHLHSYLPLITTCCLIRDVVKIEALLNVTRSKRKKIDHEDVYKKLTNFSSIIDSGLSQAIPPSSLSKDFIRPVIVCVGDSLTEGMGSSDDYLLSYPAILQRHPGFHHFQVGTCLS